MLVVVLFFSRWRMKTKHNMTVCSNYNAVKSVQSYQHGKQLPNTDRIINVLYILTRMWLKNVSNLPLFQNEEQQDYVIYPPSWKATMIPCYNYHDSMRASIKAGSGY